MVEKHLSTQTILLLIEDDPVQQKLVEFHLKNLNVKLYLAESGEKGLLILQAIQPDMILLNISLPGIDGFEVCRRLKNSEHHSHIPVIFVTAYDSKHEKLQAFRFGAEDFISKPYLGQELRVRVEAMMNRHQLIKNLVMQSLTDSLTQLPNRESFFKSLKQVMENSRNIKGYRFAVMFLDLDRFKLINDSLGHGAGDELLISIAQRLQKTLKELPHKLHREDDIIARIGGDEFTILLTDISDEHMVLMAAQRFVDCLNTSFKIQGHEVSLSVSIGVRIANASIRDSVTIVRDADTAMYKAKAKGVGQVALYRDEMYESQFEKLQLENELRQAIPNNELTLHYQPLVCLETGKLLGFESLVRWIHPTKGYMSPGIFIGPAEESGLIVELGSWVLRQACTDMARWMKAYPDQEFSIISVNVSRYQLLDINFALIVKNILQQTGLDPSLLQLEITETAAVEDLSLATHSLEELRKIGVRIALDDFGLGYSALASLHRLPLDTIKIDRSFVNSAIETPAVSAILQAIIFLSDKLQLTAIAEGIESLEQLTQLQTLNCAIAQGFFLSRPMPIDVITSLIETWDTSIIPFKTAATAQSSRPDQEDNTVESTDPITTS